MNKLRKNFVSVQKTLKVKEFIDGYSVSNGCDKCQVLPLIMARCKKWLFFDPTETATRYRARNQKRGERQVKELNIKRRLITIYMMLFILVSSPGIAEETLSLGLKTERTKDKENVEEAARWDERGAEYFKNKEYSRAIEAVLKAVELNPSEMKYVVNLAQSYRLAEKFVKAENVLNNALTVFTSDENQKILKNEIANVYYNWAKDDEKKKDYVGALKHYEAAHDIVKVYFPSRVPIALENIGTLYYYNLFQTEKAIECFEKALIYTRLFNNIYGEAMVLKRLGDAYRDSGQNEKALECYEKALIIQKSREDKHEITYLLNSIGQFYINIGQYQKALNYLKRALQLREELGGSNPDGKEFYNIATLYTYKSQYQKGLEYFNKSLQISRSRGNKKLEASSLSSIGIMYSFFCQYQKALEYHKKALLISQEVGDKSEEAHILTHIGFEFYYLRQFRKAIFYAKRALPAYQEGKKRKYEAAALHNIGAAYVSINKRKALKYYEKSLKIKQEIGDIYGEVSTLGNIACIYYEMGHIKKALIVYQRALILAHTVGNKEKVAWILKYLMKYWNSAGKSRLSIFYGKFALNLFQELRKNILKINRSYQETYFENKRSFYRSLTDIFIATGQLTVAQQVLDILKEDELYDFRSVKHTRARTFSTHVDFNYFEKQWVEKYNELMEKLAKDHKEHQLLKIKTNRNDTDERQFKQLELKIEENKKNYGSFMAKMEEAFDGYESETQKIRTSKENLNEDINELQEFMSYLDKMGNNKNVALQYIVYEDRILIILTTSSSQKVIKIKINEEHLNRMVMSYRYLMMELGRGTIPVDKNVDVEIKRFKIIKKFEKDFYNMIFKAVDNDLKRYGATNLLVSLDGVLRYLPIGTFYDGKNYLLQKYRITIITKSSLKNIKDKSLGEKRILGLGASQGGHGYPPLPNVPAEIRFIVDDEEKGYKGLIEGKAFIDKEFTKSIMIEQLKSEKFPWVHIASHFQFSPIDEQKNQLLLGDGKLMKLSDIRLMGKIFEKVELLVLSACQTGVGGNGEEIEGFGELAQQGGAKCVVASLWPVADESTKDLMITFYSLLTEGNVSSKIEALRLAQLELAGLEDLLVKDKPLLPKSKEQHSKYSYSYYWGPFIMIGDSR